MKTYPVPEQCGWVSICHGGDQWLGVGGICQRDLIPAHVHTQHTQDCCADQDKDEGQRI